VYLADMHATVVTATLDVSQAAAAIALLSAGSRLTDQMACTSEFGPAVHIIVTGADGAVATLDGEAYGCGIVTNGTAARASKTQLSALLGQLDDRLRPLAS
jgi:hypothetical protein